MELQEALKYNGKALGRIKCTYAGIYPTDQEGTAVYAIQKKWIADNRSNGYLHIADDELAEIADMFPASIDEFAQNVAVYDDKNVLRVWTNAIVATTKDMAGNKIFQSCYLLEDAIAAIDYGMAQTVKNWEMRIKQIEAEVSKYHAQAVEDDKGNIVHWQYYNPDWTSWKAQVDALSKYATRDGWVGTAAQYAVYNNLLNNEPKRILVIKRPEWYTDFQWQLSHYKEVIDMLTAQADSGTPVYVKNVAIEWYPDMREQYGSGYEQAYIAASNEADRLRTLMLAAGASSLI